jgi:hypothetical protein
METLGTLELKLARLQQKLKLLAAQEAMSTSYPEYRDRVRQEFARVRYQIKQLTRLQESLLAQLVPQVVKKS